MALRKADIAAELLAFTCKFTLLHEIVPLDTVDNSIRFTPISQEVISRFTE